MFLRLCHKTMAIAAILTFGLATNSLHAAQGFIGDDQPVNRVIKLQSGQGSNTAPPQVSYDDIEVPSALKSLPVQGTQKVQQPTRKTPAKPISFSPSAFGTTPAMSSGLRPLKPSSAVRAEPSNVKGDGKMIVTKRANMISTEISSPKYVNVNQPAQVLVNLRNEGRDAVENVRLITTLPPHTKLVGSSPQPSNVEGQIYEFTVARIGADDSRQVTLNLVPTEKQPLEIDTQVRIDSQQRTLVAVRQPALSLMLSGPQQANIGEKVVHELTVTNVGDGLATDIQLETAFPAQIRALKQSADSLIKTLEPGKTAKISFQSMAMKPGPVELKVAAKTEGASPAQAGINISVFEPQLQVSAIGPKINFVERDGIYTINLENKGEVDITDIRVALTVPTGMKVTTISRQAGVDAEKGILTWVFEKISAKSSEQIQLKATALKEGEQVCNILVSSNETSEKQFQLSTQVTTRADVSVRIRNLTGPVQVGGKAQFLVEVENQGSRRANDVNVRVILPESMRTVADNTQSVDQEPQSLTFVEPLVAPGQKVTFKFQAVGVAKGEHVIRSVLEAEGSERQVIAEDVAFVYEVDETRVTESLSPNIPR